MNGISACISDGIAVFRSKFLLRAVKDNTVRALGLLYVKIRIENISPYSVSSLKSTVRGNEDPIICREDIVSVTIISESSDCLCALGICINSEYST